jgi:putative addiction module killer protein
MEGRERSVLFYKTTTNTFPFREWRSRIADDDTRAAIDARIARFRGGNFGDSRPIGGGASENRIDFGPGYRIYYGVDGENVVLLCVGDKSTQAVDIQRAKGYWVDYKKRDKERKTAERKTEFSKHDKLPGRSSKRSKN